MISKDPAPLDSVRPGLPPGLAAVVHKAMAREADDRYASAADFTAALIPFAGRAVTPLRSQVRLAAVVGETMQSPISLPAIPVAAPTGQSENIPTAPVHAQSRVIVWAVLAVIVVLLGALGLWLVLHHEPAQPLAPMPAPAPIPAPEPVPAPAPVPVAAPTPAPPFGGFGTDSPPHLPPRASHAPVAVPAPAETPPPSAKVESPTERPPGRPPGQHPSKHTAPTVAPAAEGKVVPAAQPAETPENSPTPRRKPVRSIDRSNPFAE